MAGLMLKAALSGVFTPREEDEQEQARRERG